MSPGRSSVSGILIMEFISQGRMAYIGNAYVSGHRPVIALSSNTQISSGNGSLTTPYIIL
jgi:hypothetical protein